MNDLWHDIEAQATREWEAVVAASRPDTHVYRYYNADGELLYVGSTNALSNRDAAHKRQTIWHAQAVQRTIQGPMPRQHALLLEQLAIRNEEPIYNAHSATGYAGPGSPSWNRRVEELWDALPEHVHVAHIKEIGERMSHVMEAAPHSP